MDLIALSATDADEWILLQRIYLRINSSMIAGCASRSLSTTTDFSTMAPILSRARASSSVASD